jgi:hypothetical protein
MNFNLPVRYAILFWDSSLLLVLVIELESIDHEQEHDYDYDAGDEAAGASSDRFNRALRRLAAFL